MFAPPLYIVRKLNLTYIINHDYNIQISQEEEERFYVKQGDNMLFRQIRLLTYESNEYNRFVVFVDCVGGQNKKAAMKRLIQHGFRIGKQEFVLSERSASMVRQGILSFVDRRLAHDLDVRITMGIQIQETVLSKFYAYRGLMYSSCHCIENWYPTIVVVPDCFVTIPNQNIKYVYDRKIQFKDRKTGADREWVQKDIAETTRDIEINAFDGCGIAHPKIMQEIQRRLGSETPVTSVVWRMPYFKGVLNQMDYETFLQNAGYGLLKTFGAWNTMSAQGLNPRLLRVRACTRGTSILRRPARLRTGRNTGTSSRRTSTALALQSGSLTLTQNRYTPAATTRFCRTWICR